MPAIDQFRARMGRAIGGGALKEYNVLPGKQRQVAKPMMGHRFFTTGTFEDLATVFKQEVNPNLVFRPLNSYTSFMSPTVPFTKCIQAYIDDVDIGNGIDFCKAVTVGQGYHFKASSTNLADYVNNFTRDILGLDAILDEMAIEALSCGNSIWQFKDVSIAEKSFDALAPIPITTLQRIWWSDPDAVDATIGHYEFQGWRTQYLQPSEVVHVTWRKVNGNPFGLGLVAPLVKTIDYVLMRNGQEYPRRRMSYLDIKRSVEDTVHKILKRYINRNVYIAKNANAQQAKGMQDNLATLDDEEDFVVDGEADVKELGTASRTIDLETFTQIYQNPFIKAMATPAGRLYEKAALTEASAETAKQITIMHLASFQQTLKHQVMMQVIKRWYDANPWYDHNGVVVPWKLSKLEMLWGLPKPVEINHDVLVRLIQAKPNDFSSNEVRRVAESAGMTLDATFTPVNALASMANLQQPGGMPQAQTAELDGPTRDKINSLLKGRVLN